MMDEITFTVYGIPQPQGSMRAFMPKGFKRPILTSSNAKLKPWRQDVAGVALGKMEGSPWEGPLIVDAKFYFERPKALKKSITEKTTKPDLDKLARGLFDALTGIVFKDDSQIVECLMAKEFSSPARVEVRVAQKLPAGYLRRSA